MISLSFILYQLKWLISDSDVGRTFGHNALKRLSFIFLPVMFTLGVISTLLMALAVISVKNLAIGVVLLIVAVSQVRILRYLYFYFWCETSNAADQIVCWRGDACPRHASPCYVLVTVKTWLMRRIKSLHLFWFKLI